MHHRFHLYLGEEGKYLPFTGSREPETAEQLRKELKEQLAPEQQEVERGQPGYNAHRQHGLDARS